MKNYLLYLCMVPITTGLGFISQKLTKRHWLIYLGLAISIAISIYLLWLISKPPVLFSDFQNAYYVAGHNVLEDPGNLYVKKGTPVKGFVNLPIVAFLFVPFSFFDPSTANFLMTGVGVVSIIAACFLTLQITRVSGWRRNIIIGMFLLNGPLWYSLLLGNTTHIILLVLLGVLFTLHTNRKFLSGVLLAIAAIFKVPILLLGIYFALRRNWWLTIGFAATLMLTIAASLLLFGFDLHRDWYQYCIQPFANKAISAFNVQSVDSFLLRLLTDGGLRKWNPISIASWEFKVLRYVLLSLLVGSVIWVFWQLQSPQNSKITNSEFSIVLCLTLVISSVSWTHYYLLLLIPICLFLGEQLVVSKGKVWQLLMMLSILMVSLPVLDVKTPREPILKLLVSKLFVSHYFLGGILLFAILLYAQWNLLSKRGLETTSANSSRVITGES
jgi:hypothetical protein